jgi:hypothetical protein
MVVLLSLVLSVYQLSVSSVFVGVVVVRMECLTSATELTHRTTNFELNFEIKVEFKVRVEKIN